MIYLFLLLIFIIYTLWENENPELNRYEINCKLPNNIKSINILQISDFHNKKFGKDNRNLKKLLNKDYDLIFITGDFVDRRYPDFEVAEDFLEFLNTKYNGKIFYSNGNHEKGLEDFDTLKSLINKYNVKYLVDEKIQYRGIEIIGLDDPSEYKAVEKTKKLDEKDKIEKSIKTLKSNKFSLVLGHKPHFFDVFVENGLELVFTGHSHGGQVKLFKWGLLAPQQGFFAKYSGGKFSKNNTVMINSRGLGVNYPFVKRVFNRPELIEVIISNL